MVSRYSKVLIIPYFGQFPNYFNLWLTSCGYNKDYNFYIYTDIDTNGLPHPDNVRFICCTLDEIRLKASCVIGFDVALERPYKLCDYKPCYGAIFYDDIKDFDFWGYCDMDLIFGDISRFLPDKIFDSYDKILTCGHFTMIRNTPHINNIFKEDKYQYYRIVYSTDKNCLFDEGLFNGALPLFQRRGITPTIKYDRKSNINAIFYRHKLRIYTNYDIYADTNVNYDNLRLVWGSEVVAKDKFYKHSVFYFSRGHIFRSYIDKDRIVDREYMYIHLQKRNMKVKNTNRDEFYILKHSFENKNEIPSLSFLKRCNINNQKILFETLKIWIYILKCKIHLYLTFVYRYTNIDIRYILTRKRTLLDEDL